MGLIATSGRNRAPRTVKFQTLPWLPLKSRTYVIRPRQGRQPIADTFATYVPGVPIRSRPFADE
jgi:hypothetical protein